MRIARPLRRLPPLVVLGLVLLVTPAHAQSRVVGTVLDEDGQPIPNATVVAANPPRTFTATADKHGNFGFITLSEGNWTFTVRAPGFTPSQARLAVHSVIRNPTLKFSLERGAAGPEGGPLAEVDSVQLQDRLTEAEAAVGDGRYGDAIRLYEAIADEVPTLTTVNLKLGHAYFANRQYDKAQAAYDAALENDLDPAVSREVFFALGEIRLNRDERSEAERWYWRAHTVDPAWSKPLLKLGRMALSAGDEPGARRYLEMAAAAEPGSEENARAHALLEQLDNPG